MTLRETIQNIAKDKLLKGAQIAQVQSVDDYTCDVLTLEDEVVLTARLQTESSGGILITPTLGSMVVIMPIADFEFVVVMYSSIDMIKFLDGSFGGLVKADVLKTELDKTNDVLQAIQDTLTTWSPVANDGGAALKAAAITALSGKVIGDYSAIKNDKITHGT